MITILIFVVVTLMLLRFVSKLVGSILKFVLVLVFVILAVWYFAPKTLDKYVGVERVNKVEQWLGKKAEEVADEAEEAMEEATEYVEDKMDSVLNK